MNSLSTENGYRFEKYTGNDTCVILPDRVVGKPLTTIGTKAFLSCRSVERLVLPDTLERVEDWAFAHMKNLEEIVFPVRDILFGKKVFLGCIALKRITLTGAEDQYEGIPYFLASLATMMDETALCPELAGSREGQWTWLKEYDRLLEQFLARPDTYGFEPAFIGWFNVEDVDDQQEGYVREQKRKKAGLAFQRLLYPAGMEEDMEAKLQDYLLGKTDVEIPALILKLFEDSDNGYGGNVSYFKLWQKIGGFGIYSPEYLLEHLPEADPEVRAFLMESRLNMEGNNNFFDTLEL